ncbi:MAG: hypothetical protein ACERKZ_05770 [Lachnotalea sp.]
MINVINSIYEKMIQMDDAHEIAETFMAVEYDSNWDADTFLNNFEEVLEAELQARAEACD